MIQESSDKPKHQVRFTATNLEQFLIFLHHADEKQIKRVAALLYFYAIPKLINHNITEYTNVFVYGVIAIIDVWREDTLYKVNGADINFNSTVIADNIYFYNANQKRKKEIEEVLKVMFMVFFKYKDILHS
jgi:hypothetical protein